MAGVRHLAALLWAPLGFLRRLAPVGYLSALDAAGQVGWPDIGILPAP